MQESVCAFEGLRLSLPIIGKWDKEAYLVVISTVNSNSLSANGKETNWGYFLYSARRNKTAFFSFDTQEIGVDITEPSFYKANVSIYLNINWIKDNFPLDSDWAAKKAIELGVPLDEQGNIGANFNSCINGIELAWEFRYRTKEGAECHLKLDMLTGEVLKNSKEDYPSDLSTQNLNSQETPFRASNDPAINTLRESPAYKVLHVNGFDLDKVIEDDHGIYKDLKRSIKAYAKAEFPECVKFEGHTSEIYYVAFSPDDQLLASSSIDKTVKVWEVETGQLLFNLDCSSYPGPVKFSPDGKNLAIGFGAEDNDIKLVDLASKEVVKIFPGHGSGIESRINTIDFSPTGELIASGSLDSTVKLWEVASGQDRVLNVSAKPHVSVNAVAFNPTGKILASGRNDFVVQIWDVPNAGLLHTFNFKGYFKGIESLAFSPDGNTLACGLADGTIKLLNLTTYEAFKILRGHPIGTITSVAFSPDGQILASSSSDRTIQLWETRTFKNIRTIVVHTDIVTNIAFSSESKTLASASWDKTISLFRLD